MKKLLLSLLFAVFSISAFAQATANDLIIQGTITSIASNNPISGWPVTITGMGLTLTVFTDSNGVYSETISNGSETGLNQVFIVQAINCDSTYVTDSVSNNQGTIDVATLDFQLCAQNSNTCQALFNYYMAPMAFGQINFESTSTSLDPIATYQWSVDGMPISNNNYFIYLFPNNGGLVCLTITSSSGCSDTYCQYVNSASCLPYFNYQASTNNALEYTFTNTTSTTGSNPTYYWYFGDGDNSSEASPTHVFSQAGTYSVCLEVTTDQCQNSMCQNITVVDDTTAGNGCIANFTYVADSNTIQFNNNSYTPSQPVTFTWNFNDGTFSNELFPSHTFSTPGVYQVCLEMSTGTCSDSYCLQVYVGVSDISTSCNAQFSYSGPQVADSSYQFIGVSNDESAYHVWTFGDGSASTLEMPFHSYEVNGSYSVCHIVGINEVCADTVCSIVNYLGNEPQCDAEFMVFDNSDFVSGIRAVSLPTPGAVYTWSISGPGYENTPFSGPQFLIVPVPNEPYYVCLDYVNTETGCSASKCDTIVLQGILDHCSAEFTYFYDGYNFANVQALPQYFLTTNTYTWSVYSTVYGNGMSNQVTGNAATLTIPSNAGTVTITLNVTNPYTGCNETASDTFVVSPENTLPCNAQFTYTGPLPVDNSIQFNGLANDENAYHLWTFGDGASSEQISPSHAYATNNGAFSVCHIVGIEGVCADTVCNILNYFVSEIPDCDATFTWVNNGNGTIQVSASPYLPGTVHGWALTEISSGTVNYATSAGVESTQFTLIPGEQYQLCLTLANAQNNCQDEYCTDVNLSGPVTVGCNDFCATEILPGPDSATAMLVNLIFNGINSQVINNPYVSAITNFAGDTLATGSIGALVQQSGTQQLYQVYSVDGNALPNNFNGYVHFTHDEQTCVLPYQCLPICNAAFSWTNNGSNTITAMQNLHAAGGQYVWTLTDVVNGQTNTYTDSVYVTLQLVPGIYNLCLTYSNTAGNCSNSYCAEIVIPQNLPCNAEFYHNGPIILNNMYQFTGVANNDNAYHLWTFGDGASSEQEYPFHDFNTTGVFTVCHIVVVDGVCADTICNTIQVTEDTACNVDIVMSYAPDGWPVFSAIGGSEIATYNWILSPYDSNGIGYNGTYFYSTQNNAYVPAGTEYVGIEGCLSVTFTNGCAWNGCANFTAPPDTASFLPCNAQFTYTGPLQPDSYQFISVMNDTAAYHEWTFGDGTSSNLAMPIHSYASPGNYEVCHIVGVDGVCADTVCNTFYFGLYLAGTVNVGANCMDFGSVKLYSLDTLSNSVELVAQYPMVNNLCYYNFIGLSEGVYLVRAGLADSSTFYNDYVPTYFGGQYYWFDAEPIYLTQSGGEYNISLIYGSNPGGNGTVGGSIDDGPFRLMDPESAGVESSNPVAGAKVIVTNLSGNPQRWVDSDDSGNFNINDLDYGTYRLLADEPGMTCVPIEFTISPDFPSVFIEIVMGEELTGIESNSQVLSVGDVYPNPSQNNTFLKFNSSTTEEITIQVIGLDGKMVFQSTQRIAGNSVIEIPSSTFAPGMYFLRLNANDNGVAVNRKLQIVR